MADSEQQFLNIMKGLVSNDKTVREKNLENTKDYLKTYRLNINDENKSSDLEEIYSKIWKTFWNADKPVYQKQIAERISKLFIETYSQNESSVDKFYPLWIKTFLIEFLKKWTQIDFLRMDKYIMVVESVIKFYLEYNLLNKNFENVKNYFDYVENCVRSGFYNYSFISVILKLFIYIIHDLFENSKNSEVRKEFLEDYLIVIMDKLIKIFIIVKDKREIETFKEIFSQIANKACQLESEGESMDATIKLDKNLKESLMKKFFEVAKSKDDFPENKRKIFYKLYKKMKYNREEEDKENLDESNSIVVDPVNNYILNKNYTNKIKKSKLDRMRAMIERQKNQKRIDKILKEKEEEEKQKNLNTNVVEEILKNSKKTEIATKGPKESSIADEEKSSDLEKKEEILQENIVKLEEDDALEVEEDEDELNEEEEEIDQLEEDEDIYEDEDLEMENEEEDDDLEEYEFDPDAWFLGLDSDEEPTEEDQTLFEAYKNSQKNCEILKPEKENKKKDFLNKKRKLDRNENDNTNDNNNLSYKVDKNEKEKIEKSEKNIPLTTPPIDKRKNSVTSNSSRDGKKKKKVTFKFSRNEMNEYDQMKPINLTSKSKTQNFNNSSQLKGLLKSKNKSRK